MKFEKTKYEGIYFAYLKNKKILLTKALTPGKTFFNENIIDGYREFDPKRSKLAASIIKKISVIPLKLGNNVLYLGASHGYTSSFISDIVGEKGMVFCVDSSPRVVRDLLLVCEKRNNMAPILADANKPDSYKDRIGKIDVIYQDIAQKNQVEIFLKNIALFLKPKGYAMLALKSRSIDVTSSPKKLFEEVKIILQKKLILIDYKTLDPLEKDHCFYVCQKR